MIGYFIFSHTKVMDRYSPWLAPQGSPVPPQPLQRDCRGHGSEGRGDPYSVLGRWFDRGLRSRGRSERGQPTSARSRRTDRPTVARLRPSTKTRTRWAADFVIHLHAGAAGVGETGDNATRTVAAVGDTIDVARQLAAQHDGGSMARIVVSEAVMIAAGFDTRLANLCEIALPHDARLKVLSIAGAKALSVAEPVMAG